MKSLRIIPLLLAALTPLGCSNTDSAELGTGEIEAAMHVDVSDDDGSKAWVALTEGFNDVILSEGDRLTGRTGNGEELTFELHDNFDFYETPLPDDVAELTIELHREAGESALDSVVVVPAPLGLDMPLDGQTISAADGDLVLTWNNPIDGAGVRHEVSACDSGGVGASVVGYADDVGSHVIPASALAGSEGCAHIIVYRMVDGTVDPALHDCLLYTSPSPRD